jgi:riboflavin kinase/FMN adenylyltransferase
MTIRGTVIHGERIARSLGYPTANIPVDDSVSAANGVYAASVELDGKHYGAMANLGVKPTFESKDGARLLELHLFDFEGDLYGRKLAAELVKFIRPEQKFANADELRKQIKEDEKTIKNILICI